MSFSSELEFESALIKQLFEKGWEKTVLKNKTEKELLQNWADILFAIELNSRCSQELAKNNPAFEVGNDKNLHFCLR